MGKEITKTDLVPAFQSLLKDCEAEVSFRQSFSFYGVPSRPNPVPTQGVHDRSELTSGFTLLFGF